MPISVPHASMKLKIKTDMNTTKFSCDTTLQILNRIFKYSRFLEGKIIILNPLIVFNRLLITVMSNQNETIQLKGIYKGAKVKRGAHWFYGDEVNIS